jgi:hypothetical protein
MEPWALLESELLIPREQPQDATLRESEWTGWGQEETGKTPSLRCLLLRFFVNGGTSNRGEIWNLEFGNDGLLAILRIQNLEMTTANRLAASPRLASPAPPSLAIVVK